MKAATPLACWLGWPEVRAGPKDAPDRLPDRLPHGHVSRNWVEQIRAYPGPASMKAATPLACLGCWPEVRAGPRDACDRFPDRPHQLQIYWNLNFQFSRFQSLTFCFNIGRIQDCTISLYCKGFVSWTFSTVEILKSWKTLDLEILKFQESWETPKPETLKFK